MRQYGRSVGVAGRYANQFLVGVEKQGFNVVAVQRIVTFCFFFVRLINTLTYLLTYKLIL